MAAGLLKAKCMKIETNQTINKIQQIKIVNFNFAIVNDICIFKLHRNILEEINNRIMSANKVYFFVNCKLIKSNLLRVLNLNNKYDICLVMDTKQRA